MFERRLKILLTLLIVISGLILLRAAHLQIVEGDQWKARAVDSMKRPVFTPTSRGEIRDRRGRVLALDQPCMDAAADYRAIEENAAWLRERAVERLDSASRRLPRKEREEAITRQIELVRADLLAMWREIATVSNKQLEEIEDIKNRVRLHVEMRQRAVWYNNFEKARSQISAGTAPREWYRQFRLSGEAEADIDSYSIEVSEQTESHIILPNISNEAHNRLKKQLDRFPGLVLRPGTHRYYPYGEAACHVLGYLAPVKKEDIAADLNKGDELREYSPHDSVGRLGVEAMCETILRGSRGRQERILGRSDVLDSVAAIPGRNVTLSIDIELQREIESRFKTVQWKDSNDRVIESHEMHGAAIVIDVATGQVLALVSAPTYDLNQFEELYTTLLGDEVNRPLLNRALGAVYEPGSTVKPIVGIGAITDGLITPDDTIECTGYLKFAGRLAKAGRCWTASKFPELPEAEKRHHRIPSQAPHPTGFLTFTDALQRSCNIYFETLGHLAGLDGLSRWFDRFGLGRPTGIGLPERPGVLPRTYRGPASEAPSIACFSAIGQTQILVTPAQMANVASTIARSGIWARPSLLMSQEDVAEVHRNSTRPTSGPDRIDLGLSPKAVAAAREGMFRVVNTRAGTGTHLHFDNLNVSGKTGTAQSAPLKYFLKDANGKVIVDEYGRPRRENYLPSTPARPNPEMLWYRGKPDSGEQQPHAWFMGFAPSESPRIAFAVMFEYGGGGGSDAAIVARAVVEACIKHGYLVPTK